MLSVNVQHTERNALLLGPIQIYSGAEVSHTNRCRHFGTGAEVSREPQGRPTQD